MSADTLANQLPPVAKSFFTFCKKCDVDRYQTVLAHTNSTTAKLECEVCHTKNTYKLPKAQERKSTSTTARKTRASSESQRRSSHQAEYDAIMTQHADVKTENYNMKIKFAVNTKVNHPKFGLGFIKSVQPDKIDVIFADEIKTLVHNRGA